MKRINTKGLLRLSATQIASRIFYVLIGLAAVLFLLFRLVGFDTPYDENPDYNAPLLTGVLIAAMLLLTGVTLALAVWSFVRGVRMNSSENSVINNIPARRITLCVAGGTVLLLVLTFMCSSTDALTVNGLQFADAFWLRVSGMFIATSLAMVCAAVAALVYGMTRNRR